MSGKVKTGLLLVLCLALFALIAMELKAPDDTVDAMAAVDAPCVALTFDDGPRRETTERLLDGLAQRGIHATFFVVGTRVEGQEDIILRMEAEGHQIGIHSQTHKILSELRFALSLLSFLRSGQSRRCGFLPEMR